MKKTTLLLAGILGALSIYSQQPQKDKAIFKTYHDGFFEKYIVTGIEAFEKKDEVKIPSRSFKVDMSKMDIPKSKEEFKSYWHNDPVSQGNTSTCWCFTGTSYFETEIYRLSGLKVKLSEMYTVYWEYVERAKTFVEKRGNSVFDQGSEGNAVAREWKKYGIVRLQDYPGMLPGQTFHAHDKMYEEMHSYLNSVKATNNWNEETVVATIKDILNHYMGTPPSKIKVDGKEITPLQYLKETLRINLDDYVDVMSLMQQPYWKKVEYEVSDNWWHSKDYYNVPLDVYMDIIKKSIKKGYTVAVGGDVSEAGMDAKDYQTAIVPTFDIPSAYIDENARQFRFTNQTSTDYHGMHIIGYKEKDGVTWYLLKDSGAGSKTGGKENNKNYGYYFFHEDYVKLKMLDFTIHKDMFTEYFPKFTN
jgi:bleomycin hydrolase